MPLPVPLPRRIPLAFTLPGRVIPPASNARARKHSQDRSRGSSQRTHGHVPRGRPQASARPPPTQMPPAGACSLPATRLARPGISPQPSHLPGRAQRLGQRGIVAGRRVGSSGTGTENTEGLWDTCTSASRYGRGGGALGPGIWMSDGHPCPPWCQGSAVVAPLPAYLPRAPSAAEVCFGVRAVSERGGICPALRVGPSSCATGPGMSPSHPASQALLS